MMLKDGQNYSLFFGYYSLILLLLADCHSNWQFNVFSLIIIITIILHSIITCAFIKLYLYFSSDYVFRHHEFGHSLFIHSSTFIVKNTYGCVDVLTTADIQMPIIWPFFIKCNVWNLISGYPAGCCCMA